MKASKLREMTPEALRDLDKNLREEYFKLKFKHSIRPLEQTDRLKKIRRDIARVLTVLNEKCH
jgi:large subunit ribosomal protein L29